MHSCIVVLMCYCNCVFVYCCIDVLLHWCIVVGTTVNHLSGPGPPRKLAGLDLGDIVLSQPKLLPLCQGETLVVICSWRQTVNQVTARGTRRAAELTTREHNQHRRKPRQFGNTSRIIILKSIKSVLIQVFLYAKCMGGPTPG